ncbi:MAG: tetratricopeptide repeat protein [bacterium]|nr:tetratricopeptide repeat protein [bacterium]
MKKFLIFLTCVAALSCAGMKKANELYRNKNYESSIEQCKKAIAQDSLNTEAYLILGKSYRALDRLDDAVAAFTTVYRSHPHTKFHTEAKQELIQIKLDSANNFLEQQQYNRAISGYQEIIDMDSTNFDACYQLGKCYEKNGLLDKARLYYAQASQIKSDDQVAFARIGMIDSLNLIAEVSFQKGKNFYDQNKEQSARKYLKLALENKPDHKDAAYYFHMTEGKILYRKGSKSACWDAITHYGKAMMLRPESAEPHFHMAQAYEKKDRNEFDNAIDEYQIALNKEPFGSFAGPSKKKIKELTTRRDQLKKFWGK